MRRILLHGLFTFLLLVSLLIGSAPAAAPSPDETPASRYPVFAYFVAGFSTLFILVIVGLPSRKES